MISVLIYELFRLINLNFGKLSSHSLNLLNKSIHD